MAAGVEVEHGQAELLAASHLVEEGIARLEAVLRIGAAEVDKVAVVWQDVLWLKATVGNQKLECVNFVNGQRLAGPGLLVAGKEGEGIGTDCLGVEDCVANASACTYVSANVFHLLVDFCVSVFFSGGVAQAFGVVAILVRAILRVGEHPDKVPDG